MEGDLTGYPDAPLDARVELDLDGWTDVTKQALPDGVQYASITSGESDAAQQASPASLTTTWDNPDGRFTPRNASGPWFGLIRQNTRARVSVASPYGNVLRIDNAGTCSCPSTASLNVPADLDVRVYFDSDGWVTPGAAIPLIAKWASGSSNSWYIELIPAGNVRFWRSTTGADAAFADSSLPLPPGRLALRVTYAPSTGEVTWYTAASLAGPWTKLGDPATISGAGNIFAGTAAISLPPEDGFAGSVYAVEIRSDAGIIASPDFTVQGAGAASFTDGQGNTWTLTGGAEITGRDYRLHGELSAVNPAVDSSKANPRVQATIAGPLRRLQQGSKPPVNSAMKRAWITRPGTLAPVAYWPCEDGSSATSFGSGVGGPPMQWDAAPELASDTAFPGSDPLPVLNGSRWSGSVPAYAGSGSIITRFAVHLDTTLPSADALLLRMVGTGTCAIFALRYLANGGMRFSGYPRTGATALFDDAFSLPGGRVFWFSLEMRPGSSGQVVCSVDVLAPESASAFAAPQTPTFSGVVGKALQVDVNGNGLLTNTAVGHISVQADWETMYNLQPPLDGYRGERSGTRFLRLCQENGYPARVYGAPELTQQMGVQPAGTFYDLLQEIPDADLGIMYEPRDTFALGYRTAASMYNQGSAATLSYDESDLPGDLAPADDDQNLVNDLTVSLPDGTSVRVMEDDPALSTSTVNAGTYQNTATANLASGDGQLLDNAGQRLASSSADESRVRQVTADFGIPGAPAADLARVRPGDLIAVQAPPSLLQTGDIRQLATGATEVLGPGRAITWDCVPASPWDVAVYPPETPPPAGNLLTGDGGTFEGGIANWAQAGNATVAHSTAQAHSGTGSLAVTSVAAGPVEAGSCLRTLAATKGFPCTGGDVVGVSGWFRAATTGRTCVVQIDWFDANLASLGSTAGKTVTDTTTGWVQATAQWAAPANAAWFRAGLQVNAVAAAGETHYFDDAAIWLVQDTARADTVSSLHAAVAETDTTLTVDIADGELPWTDDGADVPFDIRCGGERIRVTEVQGPPGNSIGGDNATFETTIGTWTNTSSCSLARSTAFAHSGSGSMTMTATAAGTISAAHCTAGNILTQGKACAAGDLIAVSAWFLPNTVARSTQVGAAFYDASGGSISTVLVPAVTTKVYGWTKISGTVTAPGTAAFCRMWVQVAGAATGEIHFVDDAYISDVTTGAGQRQTLTVLRAVNGITASHAAGDDTRLWTTPRYAAL